MTAAFARCVHCGSVYLHVVIRDQVHSGHVCDARDRALAAAFEQAEAVRVADKIRSR